MTKPKDLTPQAEVLILSSLLLSSIEKVNRLTTFMDWLDQREAVQDDD